MKIEFENRYTLTDQMISEYVHKVLCRKIKRMARIFLPLSLIMTAFTFWRNDYVSTAVFGVCAFIIAFTALLSPIVMIKQLKDHDKRLHNGIHHETVLQFGEQVFMTEGSFSLTMEYSQFLEINYLKHSCVLMFSKYNGIIISPEGFYIGDFKTFQEFIRERCSHAKNKRIY